jgi:hypothetical protein
MVLSLAAGCGVSRVYASELGKSMGIDPVV